MNLSTDLIALLLVLLPGFITCRVIAALFVTKPAGTSDRLSWALVWAFVDYMLLQVVAVWSPRLIARPALTGIPVSTGASDKPALGLAALPVSVPSTPWGIVAVMAIAVAVGLLVALVSTHGWHMWLLRKLKATRRTSHASVWADAFYECRGAVLVQLKDGVAVWGIPRFFADTAEEGSLFLEQPHLAGNDGMLVEIPACTGLLVTGASAVESVQFLAAEPPADDGGSARPTPLHANR